MSYKKYNACFLVLLYNKEIEESNTLNTLSNSYLDFNNCKLVIWNNGPKHINLENYEVFKSKGFDVTVIETVDNESLAVIYNDFIRLYNGEKYVLLDDDSEINDNYLLNTLEASSKYLTVPIITMNGKIEGPTVDGSIYDQSIGLVHAQKMMAIGSGLIIGEHFANEILSSYKTIFDERFYLYGVDSTFFLRLNKLNLVQKVKVVEGFVHSLSRLESENEKITNFRRIERSYDCGLTVRFYTHNYIEFIYRLLRTNLVWGVKKLLKIHTPLSIKVFNYACIIGKHYRYSEKKDVTVHDL